MGAVVWFLPFIFCFFRLFLYLLSLSCAAFFLRVYYFLVSLFSSSLSIMSSFEKVKDVHEWLTDREAFEPRVIRSKVGLSR